jgi:hypothetical protein
MIVKMEFNFAILFYGFTVSFFLQVIVVFANSLAERSSFFLTQNDDSRVVKVMEKITSWRNFYFVEDHITHFKKNIISLHEIFCLFKATFPMYSIFLFFSRQTVGEKLKTGAILQVMNFLS